MTDEERKITESLFKHSSLLKAPYDFCCQLTGIFNSYISPESANKKINEWLSNVEKSELKCFDKLVGTIKKYQVEITNCFSDQNTSGFVEGVNVK